MTTIPPSLRTLFTATVVEHDGRYVIEVPRQEIDHGAVDTDTVHRVAVLGAADEQPGETAEPGPSQGSRSRSAQDDRGAPDTLTEPPVTEGETLEVTIETIGDQGDGIAKVGEGYVIIVPEGKPNETVAIEIDTVRQNLAFAHITEADH